MNRNPPPGVSEYECNACGGELDDNYKCYNWDCSNFAIARDECYCPKCGGEGCELCDTGGLYANYLAKCERDGVLPDKWIFDKNYEEV